MKFITRCFYNVLFYTDEQKLNKYERERDSIGMSLTMVLIFYKVAALLVIPPCLLVYLFILVYGR